jgi:cell division protein FtsI (penicillin-binding protein 3)
MISVFGRLAYLQLARHSDYMARAVRQQRRILDLTPKRGSIYDRNMHPLAMSVPVQSAFAVPTEVKDTFMAARLLSGMLGMTQDLIREKLESGATFVWIQRKLTPKSAVDYRSQFEGHLFSGRKPALLSEARYGFARCGFCRCDDKGLGGIEHEYDSLIRSKEKIVVMADARQRWFDGGEAQADRGVNIVLTIDEKIQHRRTRTGCAIEKTHAPAGTVIVQDPNPVLSWRSQTGPNSIPTPLPIPPRNPATTVPSPQFMSQVPLSNW